ncbi:hypothetical protein AAG906_039050 [Vitis piasezkii]
MDTRLFPARPDPEDTSVLTLQHRHRSSTIRVDPDMGHVLTCRHGFRREWVLDDCVRPYIIHSGFYVFHRVGHVKVDWPLITALMPVGEMTITLQDVAILFGLRVHGHPVTSSTYIDWHALCEELLGVQPTETDIRGASLRVHFITTHFSYLLPGVLDEVTLQRYARTYILLLAGGSLFLDKKGTYLQLAILHMLRDFGETAQYSWGSATLAHLCRELCRASLDMLIDERFSPNALASRRRVPLSHTDTPHHVLVTYRDEFDRQRFDQVLWQPYTDDTLALLPNICLANQDIWQMMSPFFFYILLSGIVLSGIPSTSCIDSDLHSIDRRGRPQCDWRLYHERYVALWEAREDHIVTAEPIKPHMDYPAPYLAWYHCITHCFITPMDDFRPMRYQLATALSANLLIETMTSIISRRGHALEDSDSDACRTSIVDIIHITIGVMCIIWEDYCIPHVKHGEGRSPSQSTVARLPLVRGCLLPFSTYHQCNPYLFRPTISITLYFFRLTFSSGPYFFRPTISTIPYLFRPTISTTPYLFRPTISTTPYLFRPTSITTSSDPPSVQIDTSTQLDLPPAIPRGRRGLHVLHVSHSVPTTVREEWPKRKRVLITHRFSPYGDM